MKLSRGNKGIPYTIEKINLDSDTVVRLMTIGMTHGAKIRILSKKKSGSVIILLRTTRFALGAALAEGIEIKECDHG